MTIGLIVLIAFVALVVMGGVILALLDRAPWGWEDAGGWHRGQPNENGEYRTPPDVIDYVLSSPPFEENHD